MQRDAPSEFDPASNSRAVFVIPNTRGIGFAASIHGHMLELADPADDRLAPNPNDLLIAAIASDLAWSARAVLRGYGLPDYVSVSAGWRTHEGPPSPDDVAVTVTISRRAEAVSEALAAAFARGLGGRFLAELVVDVSFEG